MRKLKLTQTTTGAWSADNAGIVVDIDKVGIITRIDATVEITPSLTLQGDNVADGPFRVIQNLRIEGGGDTYITLPADDACGGGILLHYLNVRDGHGLGHSMLTAIVAPQRTFQAQNFVIHPGSRPKGLFGVDNPFDLTAFIPAFNSNQLQATWVTSGNDVMDDGVAINSAVLRLTLSYIQGSEAEIAAEMARQGVTSKMTPNWQWEVYPHTATASDYATKRNVPAGGFLKRIAILEQDATGTRAIRAADEVTGISLDLVRDSTKLLQTTVEGIYVGHNPTGSFLVGNDAIPGGVASAPNGIYIVDLRELVGTHGHPDYGLDVRGINSGDLQLGFTITTYASGDDSLILYEKVKPYDGPLQ